MASRFAATYEASPENVRIIRNEMAALAADCGLDDERVADVKLAVSEAATNALVHAYRDRDETGLIHIEATIADGTLLIDVSDQGAGIEPRTDSPGLGLGLPVIASVAKNFEIASTYPGTSLRMTFGCPNAGSAAAPSLV